jgi:hypothetical protein
MESKKEQDRVSTHSFTVWLRADTSGGLWEHGTECTGCVKSARFYELDNSQLFKKNPV